MNISKGKIGEDNSRLLGAMLITKLYLAAMSRVDMPEEKREDFYLYVDEFQNFATESFANILSEARKYRLSLMLGHQYIAQMDETVRDAVFGNVGTLIVFRIGAEDAEELEKEFEPEFMAQDLVNLTKYNIYLKLMIDGISGRAFSAETLPPFPRPEKSSRGKIIKVSRERYSVPRKKIEEKIVKWRGFLPGQEQKKVVLPPEPIPAPKLYEAVCSKCGKNVKVIFEPDPRRPIYCEKCLKEVRGRKERLGGPGREERFTERPYSEPERRSQESRPHQEFRRRQDFGGQINEQERSGSQELKKAEESEVSLEESVKKEPVYFRKSSRESEEWRNRKEQRTKVDLGELRKVLEESLGQGQSKVEDENKTSETNEFSDKTNNFQKKILRPGERIQF